MTLLERGQREAAFEEAQRVLLSQPDDPRSLFVSARVLADRGEFVLALELIEQVPANTPQIGPQSIPLKAKWLVESGKWDEAEKYCKKQLELNSKNITIIRELAQLFNLQGRRWEATLELRKLLVLSAIEPYELELLIDPLAPINVIDEAERYLQSSPNNLLPRLGKAAFLNYDWDYRAAWDEIQPVMKLSSRPVFADVLYSQILLGLNRPQELARWLVNQGESFWSFPDAFVTSGVLSLQNGDTLGALRSFYEALLIDPDHIEALQQIIPLLATWNEAFDLSSLQERLNTAVQLRIQRTQSVDARNDASVTQSIMRSLAKLGRIEEASRWGQINGLTSIDTRKLKELTISTAWRDDIAIRAIDIPDWNRWVADESSEIDSEQVALVASQNSDLNDSPGFHLEDKAVSLGIDLSYDNGDDPNEPGMTIYQSMGGGAAAFDFDLDGFVDLYLSQAGGEPGSRIERKPNGLFRNRDGTQFVDCWADARLEDLEYSQGCAVGDWNQDGFPDLYVANFGENSLWLNQGDGTFSRVKLNGKSLSEWTVSVAIADVDGDGLPDLIDGNYVDPVAALKVRCLTEVGNRTCVPFEFDARPDTVWINSGNGTFTEQILNGPELESGIGRTIGLLVTAFEPNSGNQVFVANDSTANALLYQQGRDSQGNPLFVNRAIEKGCAFDGQGRPQASMGVAFGDLNRDLQMDMFVTNYYHEYNTLYLGSPNSFFRDATRNMSMIEVPKQTLGFGAQFVDLNNNGRLELVYLNGHIDDFSHEGQTFKMPARLMYWEGSRFRFADQERLPPYFMKSTLGRGLLVWDFNRDGSLDLVATHLDLPTAILVNQPSGANHQQWCGFELIGVDCDRDAVGAKVTIECGKETWVAQTSRGDGFACHNEDLIHFGLGTYGTIDRVTVVWPDGHLDLFENLDANRRYLLVQKQPEPVLR